MGVTALAIMALLAAQAPAAPAPAPARPEQELYHYFGTDDYPAAAQRRNGEGTVVFSVVVDPQGRPARCVVDASSGDPDLDRVTCEIIMARARFVPARDSHGQAVEDRMSSRVRWILPGRAEPGIPFLPLRLVSDVGIRGGVFHCRVGLDGQPPVTVQGEGCIGEPGDEIANRLRAMNSDVTLTTVVDFEPVGSPPRPDDPDWGELISENASRFSIGQDGRLIDCRSTRRQIYRPIWGSGALRDMCNFSMLAQGFAIAPKDAPPRLGGVRLRMYLRTGADAAPEPDRRP